MKSRTLVLFMSILFLTSGCSLSASIVKHKGPTIVKPGSIEADFAASRAQSAVSTPSGYKVDLTAGGNIQEVKQSTSGGYTVYSNVEGAIISY